MTDVPWFRRTKPDGSMAAHAAIGDNGEIMILDNGWAASFKAGRWLEGLQFYDEQMAEFSPVTDQAEVERLLEEAHAQLDGS